MRVQDTLQHRFIDADVLARFQASGPGWRDRISGILRGAADAIIGAP